MDNNGDERALKTKWYGVNWRTTGNPYYVSKGIRNEFSSYEDFQDHAKTLNFEKGLHIHRDDRDGNYSVENTSFITSDEHKKLTSRERRKLTDENVRDIRGHHENGLSTWKLAELFDVSQTTIWKIIRGISYKDV